MLFGIRCLFLSVNYLGGKGVKELFTSDLGTEGEINMRQEKHYFIKFPYATLSRTYPFKSSQICQIYVM